MEDLPCDSSPQPEPETWPPAPSTAAVPIRVSWFRSLLLGFLSVLMQYHVGLCLVLVGIALHWLFCSGIHKLVFSAPCGSDVVLQRQSIVVATLIELGVFASLAQYWIGHSTGSRRAVRSSFVPLLLGIGYLLMNVEDPWALLNMPGNILTAIFRPLYGDCLGGVANTVNS